MGKNKLLEKKKNLLLTEKKYTLIAETIKEILEVLNEKPIRADLDFALDFIKDSIKFIFNEDLIIEGKEAEEDYSEYVFIVNETEILTMGAKIDKKEIADMKKELDDVLDGLDLSKLPDDLKSDFKEMLDKLTKSLS